MPKYLHPSVSTRIIDNSHVFQTAEGTTALFQCIVSDRGPDNVLKVVTTADEFIFHYGEPNLARHGQAGYNVIEWVKAGGVAYVLRVIPSTATFAYTGIAAIVEKDTAANSATVTMMHLSDAFDDPISSVGGFETALTDFREITDDKVVVPLGSFYPFGRGEGYNDLGIRLSLRDDLDNTYNFRTYNVHVTAKNALGTDEIIEGPFIVALDPYARSNSRESLFWEDVVNKYSKFVKVKAVKDAQEVIAEFLLALTDEKDTFDPTSIDVIFGKPRANTDEADLYKTWKWINKSNAEDAGEDIAVEEEFLYNPKGSMLLKGGDDGVWENTDSEDSLLIKGYSGETSPSVLDVRFNEFDIILDGNYSVPVKEAIAKLTDVRGDCFAPLDIGFQANEEQSIEARREKVNMGQRTVAVFAQHMEVYDPYTGSNIKVTPTYFLASKIPTVDDQYGLHWPFVGPRRGVVSGFDNLNFVPNAFYRDEFYKVKLNYIERDPKKYNFATQLTAQPANSALSDINNVRTILRIRRDVEKMMEDYRMEFHDDITYDAMSSDLNGYLTKWTANRACSTISGQVYASDYDKQQKIARVKIELVFTGIIERIAIDIVVGR